MWKSVYENAIRAAKDEERERCAKLMDAHAQFLWKLLDDIDTASDIAKADDKSYREIVDKIQRRRFECGSTDGYRVTLDEAFTFDTAPQS